MMSYEEVKQIVQDMKDGTYNMTNDGKCTGCGKCCSNYLPMTDSEISTIKNYIKKHRIKEQRHISLKVLDMSCPFLDNSKSCDKCTIYPVRPRVCREFICDPAQRKPVNQMYASKCKVVDVRSEFC